MTKDTRYKMRSECRELNQAKSKPGHNISTVCPEKVSPPNILHWQVQTCPVLNKIKHALAQKYLSYCHQISYDSIIPFNRFSIFTNCCHRFQLPTWLAYYARRTSLTWRHFVDKQNVAKRRVLIKVLRVEKGYSAKRIMTEFPGRNFSLASVKRLLHQTDTTGSADPKSGSGRRCMRCGTNETVALLSAETPDFWLHRSTNSPDLNPVDYAVWSILPDPWHRPSERTTDCRMAPIWPEHHWQSCQPVAGATAWVSERTKDTLSLSIKFKWSDYLTW